MPDEIPRRNLLILGAVAVAARRVNGQTGKRFFNAQEFALLDQLSEIIIPTDELSSGAKAAGVAAYIDGSLAEAVDDAERERWRSGLHLFDRKAGQTFGKVFLETLPSQQLSMLETFAGDGKTQTPEAEFFRLLKSAVISAFYTSKVGIHQAHDYKGNIYQRGEYAGYLPAGPALPQPAAPGDDD